MSITSANSRHARALQAAASSARILVIGSLNMDTILAVDGAPPDEGAALVREVTTEVGGHAGNCASALAALGVKVSLVAAVGADEPGDRLLNDLRQRGIDVSGVQRCAQAPTGQVIIPVFGEQHYMLVCRGANDLLPPSAVRAAINEDLSAVMLFDPARKAMLATRDAVGELAKPPMLCWTPGGIYAADPVIAQLLPACDVVFLNRVEQQQAMRHLPSAQHQLPGPELVITLGMEGAELRRQDGRCKVPAPRATVVDPTGAGDAFAAAYLLARIAGLPPPERLRVANESGAYTVSAVGARARLATLPQLTQILESPETGEFPWDLSKTSPWPTRAG